ncbi:putative iron-regulated membrane protein [Wenyingzhuangia heitensis]|uniref:Iron-regulated membrane protein n=1 Tax=Wenyingzhuangia heitensis TaxID=1487859 RepID=A0ABX0U6H9_9FLAO|nr:PepSY-associated TM helix domain-containing protein [Wenyingzhuangia heitensis]NIJ44444.1 putative iron-regulated membrane protein [Wenyingzhuangia heitensis]
MGNKVSKKKKGKSSFRKINDWLHLWLGLTSGIIVFIVSITGCFYAFQQEINDVLEPWRFVEKQNADFVPPSQLIDTAKVYMPNQQPSGLTYSDAEGAAAIGFVSRANGVRSFTAIFINPYTGKFIKKQQLSGSGEFDFFRFIIDGHRTLWLPRNIGRPVVGIATLIFVFLMISGLIMWWPKNLKKANRNKSFKIKWKASFRRVNYDLHNVLGFYSLILGLMIAVTGLVWSFEWFADSLYYVTSVGDERPEHEHPHSDVNYKDLIVNDSVSSLDKAWYLTREEEMNAQGFYMTPVLKDEDDAIEIIAYQDKGAYYNRNEYYYDQYTLKPLRMKGDRYTEANFADQLTMLNYDIHIGAVLGFPGKILAFFISLICASLPITGFIIWLKKKK